MNGVGVVEGLGLLRAGLDALLAAGLGGCSDDEVLDVAREVEVARRRLAAVDHRVVCELEVRNTAVVHRARGTAGLLSAVLGVDPAEARARVTAAADLGPRWSVAGEALAPLLPATAAAQARGELSARHAAVIADTLRDVPRSVPDEVRAEVEADLAARGTELLPGELRVLGERVLAHLDPDGSLTDDTDRQRRRSFTVGKQGADGMAPVPTRWCRRRSCPWPGPTPTARSATRAAPPSGTTTHWPPCASRPWAPTSSSQRVVRPQQWWCTCSWPISSGEPGRPPPPPAEPCPSPMPSHWPLPVAGRCC